MAKKSTPVPVPTPGQILAARAKRGKDPAASGEGYRAISVLYSDIAEKRTGRMSTTCIVAPDATGGIAPGLWDSSTDGIELDASILPAPPDELDVEGNFEHHKALSALHGLFSHECGHAVHTSGQDEKIEKAKKGVFTNEILETMALLEEIRMEAHVITDRPGDAVFIRAAAKLLILEDEGMVLSAQTIQSACARAATLTEGRVLSGSLHASDTTKIAGIADAMIPEPTRSELRAIWEEAIALPDGDIEGLAAVAKKYLELIPNEQLRIRIVICDCGCHDKKKDSKPGEKGESKDSKPGEKGEKKDGEKGEKKEEADCDCTCHGKDSEGTEASESKDSKPGEKGEPKEKTDCDCHSKDGQSESKDGEKGEKKDGEAADGDAGNPQSSEKPEDATSASADLDGPIPGEAPEGEDGPEGDPACGANHSKVAGGQGRCDAENKPDNDSSGAGKDGGTNGPCNKASDSPSDEGIAGSPNGSAAGEAVSGPEDKPEDKDTGDSGDGDEGEGDDSKDSGCPDCGCGKEKGDCDSKSGDSEGGDSEGGDSEGDQQGDSDSDGSSDSDNCPDCGCDSSCSGECGASCPGSGSGDGSDSGDSGEITITMSAEDLQDLIDAINEAAEQASDEASEEARGSDSITKISTDVREDVEMDTKLHEVEEKQNVSTGKHAATASGSPIKAQMRPPTPEERAERNKLSALLKKARFRNRVLHHVTTELPPGKLRSRSAMQRSAQVSVGRVPSAEPWRQTKRRHVESPNLRVGVIVDTSGSMSFCARGVSSSLWIIANAVADVQGRVAGYAFGDNCARIVDPAKPPEKVAEFVANGGTEHVHEALLASDDALFLTADKTGQRLMIIISDGYWVLSDQERNGEAEMARLRKNGVKIIQIMVGSDPVDHGANEICVINEVGDLTTVVGNACIKALQSLKQ